MRVARILRLLKLARHYEGSRVLVHALRLSISALLVPLFFLSEQRGTTGTRKRVCPYDVVVITTPMYEKKHWDGDLADLTGQCVKVGHELFELFER